MRAKTSILVLMLIVPAITYSATDQVYQLPSQTLVDIIDAPLPPGQRLSPDLKWLLLMNRPSMPPIAELAEEELRLAGLRIKPRFTARWANRFPN